MNIILYYILILYWIQCIVCEVAVGNHDHKRVHEVRHLFPDHQIYSRYNGIKHEDKKKISNTTPKNNEGKNSTYTLGDRFLPGETIDTKYRAMIKNDNKQSNDTDRVKPLVMDIKDIPYTKKFYSTKMKNHVRKENFHTSGVVLSPRKAADHSTILSQVHTNGTNEANIKELINNKPIISPKTRDNYSENKYKKRIKEIFDKELRKSNIGSNIQDHGSKISSQQTTALNNRINLGHNYAAKESADNELRKLVYEIFGNVSTISRNAPVTTNIRKSENSSILTNSLTPRNSSASRNPFISANITERPQLFSVGILPQNLPNNTHSNSSSNKTIAPQIISILIITFVSYFV